MKIIFFGTTNFAIPILESLIQENYEIVAVITQPDRKAGRGYKTKMSPIKELALKHDLNVLQPEKTNNKEFIQTFKELRPDISIVCFYGSMIPEEILNIPKYKTINIHPSLLPKYRGSSPVQETILHGDKEAGVTLLLADKEMDHGAIIKNETVKIKNYETITHNDLFQKLADTSAQLLIKTLPDFIAGKIKPTPQNHDEATFTKLFTKEDGKIYWNKKSDEIDRQVRALNPWPGTFCFWHDHEKETTMRLKIIKATLPYMSSMDIIQKKKEGEVFKTSSGLMAVKTADDYIVIKEIQPEGKNVMTGGNFLNGYPNVVGSILS